MRVEVDQSGRVDQTDRITVLALANGLRYSIQVPATAKRSCLRELRRKWSSKDPKSGYVVLFATLLFFLLKAHVPKLKTVLVDVELPGHEASIKEHVLNLFKRHGMKMDRDIIDFQRVGKKSPAHDLAIKVFRGKVAADRKVTAEEILGEFRK